MAVTLVIVGLSVVAAYLTLVAVSAAMLPISTFSRRMREFLIQPFLFDADRVGNDGRRRQIEAEIDRDLGRVDAGGRQARGDLIQATLQAQRIRMLDQKFRSTISACVRTHWAVADGLGATHMSEAARHPMCNQLRERVIDLSELLSETIENYPLLLDSPELVRLHVGLHRIAPTCIACPYWTTTVSTAPKVCPPGHAVGCGEGSPRDTTIIDAELVDGAP